MYLSTRGSPLNAGTQWISSVLADFPEQSGIIFDTFESPYRQSEVRYDLG